MEENTKEMVRCVICNNEWNAEFWVHNDGTLERIEDEMQCPKCNWDGLPLATWTDKYAERMRQDIYDYLADVEYHQAPLYERYQ